MAYKREHQARRPYAWPIRVDNIHAAILSDSINPDFIPNPEDTMDADRDDMEEIIWESTQLVWVFHKSAASWDCTDKSVQSVWNAAHIL